MNSSCVENMIAEDSLKCPSCGTTDIATCQIPETAADVGVLRTDYNRRNMHKPGFVPSVAYDRNGKPIVS
jgi:hypothetical protein